MINKFGDRRKRQCEYSIESKCSSEFWRDDEWTSSTSKRSKKKDKYNQALPVATPWETFTMVFSAGRAEVLSRLSQTYYHLKAYTSLAGLHVQLSFTSRSQ